MDPGGETSFNQLLCIIWLVLRELFPDVIVTIPPIWRFRSGEATFMEVSCREGVRSADVLDALNVESNLFFGLVNVRVSIYFKPLLSLLLKVALWGLMLAVCWRRWRWLMPLELKLLLLLLPLVEAGGTGAGKMAPPAPDGIVVLHDFHCLKISTTSSSNRSVSQMNESSPSTSSTSMISIC